jgi:ABC-type uncharacterized transport system involved in gliding motility auxiliary subunit
MFNKRSVTIFLIAAIAALSIHFTYGLFEGVRADFTDDDIYSLSDGTLRILERMQEEGVQPIEMRLYFSETNGNTLPRFIKDFVTYERYLRHLLRSYERASDGRIRTHFIDPLTDSDEEEDAIKDGLEGRAINQHGDQFFFGLAIETQTGSRDSIPFLWPQEQEAIEYEITKRLTTLAWPASQRIALLSSLEIFGTADNPYLAQMLAAQGRTPSEKWLSVQLLEEAYQVSQLPPDVDHISHDEHDLVLVVHPKELSRKALWALDEWVVTGGKTLIFLDPYSITDTAPENPQQPWAALQYEPASHLDTLLAAWGLEMPRHTVAADFDLAVTRQVVRGGPNESVVVDLQMGPDDWPDPDNPIVQGLANVRFFMPGVLREVGAGTGTEDSEGDDEASEPSDEDREFTLSPLVATTATGSSLRIQPGFGSGTGDGLYYTDLNNAARLRDAYRAGEEAVAIAYQLDGKLPSAFPEGVEFPSTEPERPPGLPPDIELPPPEGTEMVRKDPVPDDQRADTGVLVFADVDLISDQLGFQRNILGIVNAANDNHKLLLNSVDFLLGARELMAVRTARRLDRPFTLFDEIEADAERETLERERQIRAEIEGFQLELQTKQGEITERNAALFQKRLQDEVDLLNEGILESNAELRRIRLQRRTALENEENRIRFSVLGWMPTVVLLFGVGLFLRRRKQHQA